MKRQSEGEDDEKGHARVSPREGWGSCLHRDETPATWPDRTGRDHREPACLQWMTRVWWARWLRSSLTELLLRTKESVTMPGPIGPGLEWDQEQGAAPPDGSKPPLPLPSKDRCSSRRVRCRPVAFCYLNSRCPSSTTVTLARSDR